MPEPTFTVWPGWTTDAAFEIVQKGAAEVPCPLSEQFEAWLSTYKVVTVAADAGPIPNPAAMTASAKGMAPRAPLMILPNHPRSAGKALLPHARPNLDFAH
jgi:hypothetical protein